MRRKTSLRLRLLAALVAPVAVAHAGQTNWLDIESRIQYGYFTEDVRSLKALLEPLSSDESGDPLQSYYLGLLTYRLTQLAEGGTATASGKSLASADRNVAREMAESCVSALERSLARQNDFADALALESACLGQQAQLGGWRAPLAGPKSTSLLRKALQVAPRNPRVLLIDAVRDYQHSKAAAGDAGHACGKFKKATALFEAERAQVDQVPGWGAAEAYTWLGRCYLDSGDTLTARDALERALLIAPEFSQARRLLTTLTSG